MSYKEDIQNTTPIIYTHSSYNIEDIIQRIFPNSDFDVQIKESKDGYRQFLIIDKHQHVIIHTHFIIKCKKINDILFIFKDY